MACFAGAITVFLLTLATPLATLAFHYHLWAHLVQNVALAEWIPLLLVAAVPPALAEALARYRLVRLLTRPLVALPLWLGSYLLWHVPAAYETALSHHWLLQLEHLTYLAAGCLLWWPVLQATPVGRLGTPEEVAAAVAFLLGPEAGWISGVCLPLDGGFTAASFFPVRG